MNTYLEMTDELASRLQVADSSTLYPLSRRQTLVKDAYLWSSSLFMWPQTQKAKKTSTATSQDYYDYPEGFLADSIDDIYIDGVQYEPINFNDFKRYRNNYPSDTSKKYYSDYGRQIFIFPTPSSNGSLNMEVWGHEQVTQLSASGDYTIFSLHNSNGNEAIVKKAFSVAIKRTDPTLSASEEKDAIGLLTVIFDKIQKNQYRYQRKDAPFFDVPNFYGNGVASIGKFSYE